MAITQSQFIQGPVTPGGSTVALSSTDLAAGSVGTSQLAANAVTKAKMAISSGSSTGTGSAQSIAHGLGVVPSLVLVIFTGATSAQTVNQGTHTTSNVVVTVTTAATYQWVALA